MKKNRSRGRGAFQPRGVFVGMMFALGLLPGLGLCAQNSDRGWEAAAGGRQSFDVASVRQDQADDRPSSNFNLDNGYAAWVVRKGDRLGPGGDLFSAKGQTLMRYISFAYKLSATQELALRFDYYSGLRMRVPEWVNMDRYDIEARAPGPATKDQMRLMLQSLLADRFKLVAHWETREAPVFALVEDRPGKLGRQIEAHPASDDCAATAFPKDSEDAAGAQPATALSALPIPCGMIAHLPPNVAGRRSFGGRNVTLALVASSLPFQTGLATLSRPVIDGTGLIGGYDLWLEWAPEDTSEVNNHETGGTFREALKEQLGLKLKPESGPVQILVIDHVEPPSPN